MLTANANSSVRERLTLTRVFEELRALGYEGGCDAVRRYARKWSHEHAGQTAADFVPLSFAPGETYQFDWSLEIVVMNGVTMTGTPRRAGPPRWTTGTDLLPENWIALR